METTTITTTTVQKDTARIGRIIKSSRRGLGIERSTIAKHLGISKGLMLDYENGKKLIPGAVLIELIMFGISRWR